MKFRFLLFFAFGLSILLVIQYDKVSEPVQSSVQKKYNGPEQFLAFHQGIRTPEGYIETQYEPGYLVKEFDRSMRSSAAINSANARTTSTIVWTERGPANVPGRTRGLVVMPNDPNKNTWIAGASGGGVWKTTNAGLTWINKSANFPTLAVATIAVCTSSPTVLYAGTGEYIASSGTAINGNGIFKSTDGGENWTQLPSTANSSDFISVTRVIVDPNNPNIVLACSAPNTWGSFSSTIMRSTNGGTSWTKVFNVPSAGAIEQLIATPGNFNIQYASQNGVGVLKSINAGATWTLANSGMSPSGRLELAVSPVNTNRIFASAVGSLSGNGSDMYISNDGAATWSLVNVSFNNNVVDFLGGQGWYDNTIACDPFNADKIYFGGVGLFSLQLGTGSTSINSFFAQEDGTTFMTLTNFGGDIYGGRIRTSSAANASVEVRFGSGKTQKAHRFLVPIGATTGVPAADFTYQNYVDVPFEVWQVDANGNDVQQLMASFRDQDRNGEFNLLLNNTTGTATEQSREYVYVNNQPYNPTTPNPNMTTNGGHAFNEMYFFWPVLSEGSLWTPGNLPASEFRILLQSVLKLNATTITVADPYGAFDSKNRFLTFGVDVHPDQHNLVMVPTTGSNYKILASNDGGIFVSNTSTTPGIAQGDWTMVGNTYNTSQFYGADKRPDADEYIGGMQDNGTWKSPSGLPASAATNYLFNIGGDGFEVLWHSRDAQKIIGGSQGNNFRRSIDGGSSWSNATSGLTGDQPFISKLANSKYNPEVIFTASSLGVFRSTNFGSSWVLTPITQKWAASTFLDVEVSKANANVIWAGSGMTSTRNLHVSTNGGQTFNVTNNFASVSLGSISKLASHPFEKNTAYAMFSFSGKPKILRTTDLGQTWEDISGFGTGNSSITGFPNVAVYCLYVRPDDPNIIWAGTEIGIVESLDNGQTWALRNDFPHASVWDMKGQDNQVVIATHGRGIWTATLDESQSDYIELPEIILSGTSAKKDLKIRINNNDDFDSVQFYISSQFVGTIKPLTPGQFDVAISGVTPGLKNVNLIVYKDGAPFYSKVKQIDHLNILSVENSYTTYFNSTNDLKLSALTLQDFPGSAVGERRVLQTQHPYQNNTTYRAILLKALKVNSTNPILYYSNIAITEPGKDTVLIEATKNGLDWITLSPRYDASSNPQWQDAFTNGLPGIKSMFDESEIDLSTKFNPGDSIVVRFSLTTNATVNSWGWAINYITIQQAPTALENPLKAGENLALFPNPTAGEFTIEFNLARATEVNVEIVDLFGRTLDKRPLGRKELGTHNETFNLSSQPRGAYFVVLKTNTGNKIGKISVKR